MIEFKCKNCGSIFRTRKSMKFCPKCSERIVGREVIINMTPPSKPDHISDSFVGTEIANLLEIDFDDWLDLEADEKDSLILKNKDIIFDKYIRLQDVGHLLKET